MSRSFVMKWQVVTKIQMLLHASVPSLPFVVVVANSSIQALFREGCNRACLSASTGVLLAARASSRNVSDSSKLSATSH